MVGVAIVTMGFSWFQLTMLSMFSERIAESVKVQYFKACMEKDADFYDQNNPTEMGAKIAKEVTGIQRGLGEKFGTIIMGVVSFCSSFVFAFYQGWTLTLYILLGFPVILAIVIYLGVSVKGGIMELTKSYTQSAGYAEQALQAVKIVHTYGNELLELKNFSKYLIRSKKAQQSFILKLGVTMGLLFGVIFAYYALAFYVGGYLRWNEVTEGGTVYSGGKVISVIFLVLIGSF